MREAFMAVALELRYDKNELLHAYVNEIYLGQDGARAMHGFGLASQFYFGKPLAELELHELALLVAEVRGPTYYDPRRHADRARERRNFVLQRMADEGLASNDEVQKAAERDLGLVGNQPPQRDAFGVLGLSCAGSSPPTTRATISSARASSCCRRSIRPCKPRPSGRLTNGIDGARQERGGVRRRRRRHEPAHGRGESARRRPRRELRRLQPRARRAAPDRLADQAGRLSGGARIGPLLARERHRRRADRRPARQAQHVDAEQLRRSSARARAARARARRVLQHGHRAARSRRRSRADRRHAAAARACSRSRRCTRRCCSARSR